jgi:hypothetical protein
VEGGRLWLAVEAGAGITQALAGDDATTVIVRRVAQARDEWKCDLYEYDPESRMLTATALWAREMTDVDRAWVGTSILLDERPGYLPIIGDGACVLSDLDDLDLDSADRAAMEEWGETSVSSGVAVFPVRTSSPEGLVEHADAALYAAERAGKDRVEPYG